MINDVRQHAILLHMNDNIDGVVKKVKSMYGGSTTTTAVQENAEEEQQQQQQQIIMAIVIIHHYHIIQIIHLIIHQVLQPV